MFVKLRKCWRMLQSAMSLCTPENSAIQKLSIIIIYLFYYYYTGKLNLWSDSTVTESTDWCWNRQEYTCDIIQENASCEVTVL